jgi:hypothetical protein
MSTSYTRFKKPITRVSIDTTDHTHDKITIWVDHQNAGTIVVDAGQGNDFLDMFDSGKTVLHCYSAKGPCVIKKDPDISNDEYVISEYNEITKAGKVLEGRTIVPD